MRGDKMGYIEIRMALRTYLRKKGIIEGLKDIMGILHVLFIELEQEGQEGKKELDKDGTD
jgi:hypothetical protein